MADEQKNPSRNFSVHLVIVIKQKVSFYLSCGVFLKPYDRLEFSFFHGSRAFFSSTSYSVEMSVSSEAPPFTHNTLSLHHNSVIILNRPYTVNEEDI